jgi:CubicO group peptidase (beta-lactamase class C family)
VSIPIHGFVAPGFESVKEQLQRNFSAGRDRNAQLCVYVGETCVVDLWASSNNDPNFSGDSLINVFSSGKSLESILLAMLVDQESLDFTAPVQRYWPEFRGQGKDTLTVADVMRHEAGLAFLSTQFTPEQLQAPALQQNVLGKALEEHTLSYPQNTDSPREYHAISRGWIANEIFRRVDSQQRTMGEYLRQKISDTLGIDVYISLKPSELERISPVHPRGFWAQLWESTRPNTFARKIGLNLTEMLRRFWHIGKAIPQLRGRPRTLPIVGLKEHSIRLFDTAAVAQAEIPSAGAKCSARGLAKLAAVMANGGVFEGQRLLSEDAWQQLHAASVRRKMTLIHAGFTQGGLAAYDMEGVQASSLDASLSAGREGFYGWMGYGGSVFQWHPELRIGFAYVPTALNALDFFNQRAKWYQQAVVNCLR